MGELWRQGKSSQQEGMDRHRAVRLTPFLGRLLLKSPFPGSGCLAQLVERRPYKANVGGSIPSAPTNQPSYGVPPSPIRPQRNDKTL
jgi:hypothetical protein